MNLSFQELCRTARMLFGVPAASLCLADGSTHWIDLAAGLTREPWRFAATLEGRPDRNLPLFVVEDAMRGRQPDEVSAIPAAPHLRFLASIGLRESPGGQLAIFDTRPHPWTSERLERLRDLATIADTTLRFQQEAREAAKRERHFRLLAETSTDTIIRGNLDGVRLYISPSVRDLLGYEPEEMLGLRAIDITHADDIDKFGDLMKKIRSGKLPSGFTEIRQRHRDGSWVWMEASVRLTRDEVTGVPDGYVASVRNIARRKAAEERLAYYATHDELTGLPNRKLFRERVNLAVEALHGQGKPFALFCLDIDRFKQVNDERGHQAGDEVLREAAFRFRSVMRDGDTIARLGGDEFSVLQPMGAGPEGAVSLARRLIEVIGTPLALSDGNVSVGLSIGIACAPESGLNAEELTAAADRALYRAKEEGRNTFRFATNRPGRLVAST